MKLDESQSKEVSMGTALLTFFGMPTVAIVVLWLLQGAPSLTPMLPIVGVLVIFYPLGLAWCLPDATFGKHPPIELMFVIALSYFIYPSLFALMMSKRKTRAFLILALFLFIVLCFNVAGCKFMLRGSFY